MWNDTESDVYEEIDRMENQLERRMETVMETERDKCKTARAFELDVG